MLKEKDRAIGKVLISWFRYLKNNHLNIFQYNMPFLICGGKENPWEQKLINSIISPFTLMLLQQGKNNMERKRGEGEVGCVFPLMYQPMPIFNQSNSVSLCIGINRDFR